MLFQLDGYELETNFEVVDEALGVEDFLLGRNFLRAYQVLVDLTIVVARSRKQSTRETCLASHPHSGW